MTTQCSHTELKIWSGQGNVQQYLVLQNRLPKFVTLLGIEKVSKLWFAIDVIMFSARWNGGTV